MNSIFLTKTAQESCERMNADVLENDSILSYTNLIHKVMSMNKIMEGCRDLKKGSDGLKGRAMVLGFGNGIEIPLDALCNEFEEVLVVDLDEKAVTARLNVLSEIDRKKVQFKKIDLSGIMAGFSQECEKIVKNNGIDQLIEELPKIITKFSKHKPVIYLPKCSYVVSSLVLSQLGFLVDNYVRHLLGNQYKKVITYDYLEKLSDLSCSLQEQHIENIANCCLGNFYFADTVSLTLLDQDQEGKFKVKVAPHPMVAPRVFQVIQSAFTELERSSWSYMTFKIYKLETLTFVYLFQKNKLDKLMLVNSFILKSRAAPVKEGSES